MPKLHAFIDNTHQRSGVPSAERPCKTQLTTKQHLEPKFTNAMHARL